MGTKRIVILQNQIGQDGRSRVTTQLIRLFNRYGIVPEVATFSGPRHVQAFLAAQDGCAEVRVRRSWFPTGRGYLAQVLLHNALSRLTAARADLVVNMNDNFHFLPPVPQYLHYISDPVEEKLAPAWQSPARPWAAYGLACRALARIGTLHTEGLVVVNSAFTRDRLAAYRPEIARRAHVVFPPCGSAQRVESGDRVSKTCDVVNVGTFSAGKRQMEVLQLAERNPDLRFVLIGSVWDRDYVRRCLKFKQERQLENVQIVTDARPDLLNDLLAASRVYLHLKADEGFGISTVEAIARGCLPLVPDSGGQKEVVPQAELRYTPGSDLNARLGELCRLDEATRDEYVRALRAHIRAFSVEAFRRRMQALLLPLLDIAASDADKES